MGSAVGALTSLSPATQSRSPGNADLVSGGCCLGSARHAVGVRIQAIREGAWRSVGQASQRELPNPTFIRPSSVMRSQAAVAQRWQTTATGGRLASRRLRVILGLALAVVGIVAALGALARPS